MPPAYIHLRCEIIGRFVQAYVPCTTAVFIPPSHPPSAYIQNYRHRIWYRYSLILFFWMTGRRQGTATDTRVAPVAESTQTLPPLPAPLPAKGNVAANMPKAPSDPLPENDLDTNNGTINDTLPESIPSVPNDAATPNMSAQAQMPTATASTQNAATTAASSQPTPIPGKMPPPDYPVEAAARGDHGTVTVRILVDAEGAPSGVEMAKSSGSHDLDNAALQTVRNWRFKPARNSNDQPVPGSIEIPFEFNVGQ